MKDLKQITVIGLGLLGASITSKVLRSFSSVKAVGYTHRAVTRLKARELTVASEIVDDIKESVSDADIVILATPICTFEKIFSEIAGSLKKGCIVTDVGSTKVLPHRWAAKNLPKTVHYVGSHPIAGSEQRGVEFARDDLFDGTLCILTTTAKTNRRAVRILNKFWSDLGCNVKTMSPVKHDKVLDDVSNLPHIAAAALINANNAETLKFAGKGFMDTSRIASGPPNIWADILITNTKNTIKDIDKIIVELRKIRKALKSEDKSQVERLLKRARDKRNTMMEHKLREKEIQT